MYNVELRMQPTLHLFTASEHGVAVEQIDLEALITVRVTDDTGHNWHCCSSCPVIDNVQEMQCDQGSDYLLWTLNCAQRVSAYYAVIV